MLQIQHGSTSVILRFLLKSKTTGAPQTGLTSSTAGLQICVIADTQSTTTNYLQSASNIETITTLGTYAAPTSGKCRFKEVSATYKPGLYEFQFANAIFASTAGSSPDVNSKILVVSVSTVATGSPLVDADAEGSYEIQLTGYSTYATPTNLIDFFTANTGSTFSGAVAGSVVKEIADNVSVASGGIAEAAFDSNTAKYQMKLGLTVDNSGTSDRYTVIFFTNGQPIFSGITSPTIQVIKTSDGSDLIASTSLTQVASTGLYKYTATSTARITSGATYVAKISATIDGSTRTWAQFIGRDT